MATETKKCKKCGEDIPVKFVKCNHCGANQYQLATWVALGLFGWFLISMMSLGSDTPAPQPTPTPQATEQPVSENTSKNGTYVVSSPEFEFMGSKRVNLWRSYDDRTLTGVVNEGDIVEITNYDRANNYCYATMNARQGWASCGWFVKQ